MLKRIVLTLVFLGCWQGWTAAQVYEFDNQQLPFRVFGEFLFHRAAIDGTVQWTDTELLGTEVDLDGTFGLKDTNGIGAKAGLLIYGAHEFIFDYRRYHLDKETTLETSVRFGDFTLPLNLPISPSLTFQAMGVFYGYRLLNRDFAVLAIRPGVEFVNYEVGVTASLLGAEYTSETLTGKYTVPFLWIVGEVPLHPMLALAGEFSGGWRDSQQAYWGQALLKFTFHPNIAALLGYSRVWFKDDAQDDTTSDSEDHLFEVALSGIVIGARVVW